MDTTVLEQQLKILKKKMKKEWEIKNKAVLALY